MTKNLPSRRPAETSAVAAALALLIARLLGVDDADTVTALAIVIGFVPAAVTWLYELRHRDQGHADGTTLLLVVSFVLVLLMFLKVFGWL